MQLNYVMLINKKKEIPTYLAFKKTLIRTGEVPVGQKKPQEEHLFIRYSFLLLIMGI
jgi:hypothetical protein